MGKKLLGEAIYILGGDPSYRETPDIPDDLGDGQPVFPCSLSE